MKLFEVEMTQLVTILIEFDCYNEEVRDILIKEIRAFVDDVLPEKLSYEEEVVVMSQVLSVIELGT